MNVEHSRYWIKNQEIVGLFLHLKTNKQTKSFGEAYFKHPVISLVLILHRNYVALKIHYLFLWILLWLFQVLCVDRRWWWRCRWIVALICRSSEKLYIRGKLNFCTAVYTDISGCLESIFHIHFNVCQLITNLADILFRYTTVKLISQKLSGYQIS